MQARIHIAEMILLGLQGYVAVGALVAFLFVVLLPRIEPSARAASLGARIVMLPGAMLLWPYVLIRSVQRLRNKSTVRAE